MNIFISFMIVYALCSVFVKAEDEVGCVNKYYVVNTYQNIDKILVTCYSKTSDCNVTYLLPEANSPVTKLGTVPAGVTQEITQEIVLGGRLYSNYQIGVQYVHPDLNGFFVTLPRATNAGTKFAAYFWFESDFSLPDFDQCVFAALEESATVEYRYGDKPLETFTIDSFQVLPKSITFKATENVTIRVTSSSPIIISCSNTRRQSFNSWEPILNKPVFGWVFSSEFAQYATIVLSNCETNEEILDLDKVRIEYAPRQINGCQFGTQSPIFNASIFGSSCSILVTPLDLETCVSISMQEQYEGIYLMGSSIQKRVLETHIPSLSNIVLYKSLVMNNCQITGDSKEPIQIQEESVVGHFLNSFFFGSYGEDDLAQYDYLTCTQPAFLSVSNFEGRIYSFANFGLLSEDTWEPFFDYTGCDEPTPTPTPTPTLTPSSSGANYEIFGLVSTLVSLGLIWFN